MAFITYGDAQQRVASLFLRLFYRRSAVQDLRTWHKVDKPLGVVLTNGERSDTMGQLWGRQVDDVWEYKQDAPTDQDFEDWGNSFL
jgi:hypothetical protein